MKLTINSFKIKLWFSLIVFSVIIFGLLWLTQIVFFQSVHNRNEINHIEKISDELINRISSERDGTNIPDILDRYAFDNSALILITDKQGKIIHKADENDYFNKKNKYWFSGENIHKNTASKPGDKLNWEKEIFSRMLLDYDEILKELEYSKDGTVKYIFEDDMAFAYGKKIPAIIQLGSEERVLYISKSLGSVHSTIEILRTQLIWMTIISLIIGFIIAYFVSKKFAKPISDIIVQARKMSKGEFDIKPPKGFCIEIDELSNTMEKTAAELERLENSRREMVANISHDFRTPLTIIKGYAEIIKETSWQDPQMKNEDLSLIISEADRLTQLVNNVLMYSATQDNNRSFSLEMLNAESIVREVVDQFYNYYKFKGYEIDVSAESDLWVMSTRQLLNGVLYNLIDNALHHTSNYKIKVILENRDQNVRFSIQDYGEGIPQNQLPYVWDKYFTSQNRPEIKGIGLSIVKKLLIKQNADFGVKSIPGKGCQFWFELERIDKVE